MINITLETGFAIISQFIASDTWWSLTGGGFIHLVHLTSPPSPLHTFASTRTPVAGFGGTGLKERDDSIEAMVAFAQQLL